MVRCLQKFQEKHLSSSPFKHISINSSTLNKPLIFQLNSRTFKDIQSGKRFHHKVCMSIFISRYDKQCFHPKGVPVKVQRMNSRTSFLCHLVLYIYLAYWLLLASSVLLLVRRCIFMATITKNKHALKEMHHIKKLAGMQGLTVFSFFNVNMTNANNVSKFRHVFAIEKE